MAENKNEKEKELLSPDWIKLDNAATIYPPTVSRKLATMFRLSVTLDEEADPAVLREALLKTVRRMPQFGYKLKTGLFWCYFSKIDGDPSVEKDVNNPMTRIDSKENGGFQFRLRYYGNRVALEVFHALTDGTGGLTFLLTLTAEYLRMRYGCDIPCGGRILDVSSLPEKGELEDAFYRYCRKYGAIEHEKAAYHPKGTVEEHHVLHIVTGKVSTEDLKKKAAEYGCTVTAFVTSLLICSLQEIKERDPKENKRGGEIKVSIPVNLRNYYPTGTLRNFSSYVNVGIDTGYGHYSFDETVKAVKGQMADRINEKKLNSKFTANVRMQKNVFIRAVPMFIKKHILSLSDRMMGDRYVSTTFSNLGFVTLPPEMEKHVNELNFVLGRSRGKPGSVSCVGYKDRLFITFSRKIREADIERIFFRSLVEMGIGVEIESNRRSQNVILR